MVRGGPERKKPRLVDTMTDVVDQIAASVLEPLVVEEKKDMKDFIEAFVNSLDHPKHDLQDFIDAFVASLPEDKTSDPYGISFLAAHHVRRQVYS